MKSLYSVDRLDITFIIAAIFFTISVNVHNDLCDRKLRTYSKNFLKAVIITPLIAGLIIFPNPFVITALIVTYLYNWKLKKILYISLLSMVPPGLAVMFVLGIYDMLPILAVIFAAIAGQSVHQFTDKDIRDKSYFYIYLLSFFVTVLLFVVILIPINIALSWLIFVIVAHSGLNMLRTGQRNKFLKKLTHFTIEQRRVGAMELWSIVAFLVGWYLLI